jgi:hypothetical protein
MQAIQKLRPNTMLGYVFYSTVGQLGIQLFWLKKDTVGL